MPPVDCSTFTGLETVLISILLAFVACLGTFLTMGRRFMSRSECVLNHELNAKAALREAEAEADANNKIQASIGKLMRSQDLQFKMLRGIITYMDLAPDVKEKLLNMTSGPDK